jgi:hypothetical protein
MFGADDAFVDFGLDDAWMALLASCSPIVGLPEQATATEMTRKQPTIARKVTQSVQVGPRP